MPTKVIGVVPLPNAALAASAANRRRWGRRILHHIVDPRPGEPDQQSRRQLGGRRLRDGRRRPGDRAVLRRRRRAATWQAEFGAGWLRVSGAGSAHWSPTFQGELFR